MKPESYFITGTDTGVGKTMVTALLALRLRALGHDVGVMKPIASGCRTVDGELVSDDALWLREITGVDDDLRLINPVRYAEPLAPLVAARRSGDAQGDDLERVITAYKQLKARHEIVLVEGIGGLLVPIQPSPPEAHPPSLIPHPPCFLTCANLAEDLELPVVVVARRTLGTINHTLLTCGVPLRAPARFAGLVFCDSEPVADDDIAAATSPALIGEITGLPICGCVPYVGSFTRSELERIAGACFTPAS